MTPSVSLLSRFYFCFDLQSFLLWLFEFWIHFFLSCLHAIFSAIFLFLYFWSLMYPPLHRKELEQLYLPQSPFSKFVWSFISFHTLMSWNPTKHSYITLVRPEQTGEFLEAGLSVVSYWLYAFYDCFKSVNTTTLSGLTSSTQCRHIITTTISSEQTDSV